MCGVEQFVEGVLRVGIACDGGFLEPVSGFGDVFFDADAPVVEGAEEGLRVGPSLSGGLDRKSVV